MDEMTEAEERNGTMAKNLITIAAALCLLGSPAFAAANYGQKGANGENWAGGPHTNGHSATPQGAITPRGGGQPQSTSPGGVTDRSHNCACKGAGNNSSTSGMTGGDMGY